MRFYLFLRSLRYLALVVLFLWLCVLIAAFAGLLN